MARKKDSATRYPYEPDYAVPPGQTLQETIDALGIDQRELAARAELSAKHVNQIIKGIAPITHDTAIRLERVTGVPARMWNNLESNYREQLARIAAKDRLQQDPVWLKSIPTRELMARGAIEPTTDKVELLEAVLSFFGVATVEAWKDGWSMPQFAFRKSLAFEGKAGAMATWLRLGEIEAQKAECAPFDKAAFRAALDEIRSLTVKGPEQFVPRMIELCAASGVALVLVPEIKGAPVSGAAKWLTPTKAMICLNLRGKSNDRFWFTLFHEAGHILNDSKKETFIDVDYQDDPREHQANQFAASLLIPTSHNQELHGLTSYPAVEAFARRIGIAPGIVVGRLQREGVIGYHQFNGLRQRLQWAED
ncbi:MAG: HigA family addiction module antidote protein [Pirellulaceae bacterium]|nr:HigA family addiction module antidote protein [Pirellulaceae bacterium]